MTSGCSTDFSMVSCRNRVLTTLKSASNIRISSFVHHSQIFVWEGESPSEDLKRRNKSFGTSFRRTFQRFLDQIECSRP